MLPHMTDVRLLALTWRIFYNCCTRYGVSGFDEPTFRIIYPEEYRIIKTINAELRRRAQ